MAKSIQAEHPSIEELLARLLIQGDRQRVFIPSFNQWPFAIATWVDIAAVLHSQGAMVFVAPWAQDTPLADVGRTTEKWANRLLRSSDADESAVAALKVWGIPESHFLRPHVANSPVEPISLPAVLSRSAVRNLTYGGSRMGKALLQVTPERDTPTSEEFIWPRKWIEASVRSFGFVYDNVRAAILEHGITSVIIYNGRFLHDQAARAAALDVGIRVIYYDSSGTETDYEVTDHDIHDWSALQQRMITMFHEWPEPENRELGAQWFERRVTHSDPRNQLFVEAQHTGEVPSKPVNTKWVVYFSSSGDEIVELDIDWNEYFGGQRQALLALAEEVRKLPDHQLIVRSHPHKRHKPPLDVQEWLADVADAQPDLHLGPESSVDSYALMRQADVVVTYGSTSGVEAAYAGKPVIVMGPSAYDELGCATRVRNQLELAQALAVPEPGDRDGALAYGLMAMRRGVHFAHVKGIADGVYALADTVMTEAPERSRHVSHALRMRRRRRLIQQ